MSPKVLVTGVSGYLGSWCAHMALEAGFEVVGTVRNPDATKCAFLGDPVAGRPGKLSQKAVDNLTVVKADLLSSEEIWDELFAEHRFDYVIHTASPFLLEEPKNEDEYIRPAVQGTTSIIKACIAHDVKRVVLTSSAAAVKNPLVHGRSYTEADWSDASKQGAYVKSKTLAERKAWELVKGASMELCTVLPMWLIGPTLYTDAGLLMSFESEDLAARLMSGRVPLLPNVQNAISDVRDVAKVHVTAPGHRFVTCGATRWFADIAGLFAQANPEQKIPTRSSPNFAVPILALFSPAVKRFQNDVGIECSMDSTATQRALSIEWTPEQETVAAMVDDFIALGAVQKPRKQAAIACC